MQMEKRAHEEGGVYKGDDGKISRKRGGALENIRKGEVPLHHEERRKCCLFPPGKDQNQKGGFEAR